jgi:hypothetical protein
MKGFSPLSGSEGPRREFKITWGLRAGYGTSGRIYDLEEAIRAAHRWMRERHARGEPFLSGMFTRGEVVYAGSEADAAHGREPVAIFHRRSAAALCRRPGRRNGSDAAQRACIRNRLHPRTGRGPCRISRSHLDAKAQPVTVRCSPARPGFSITLTATNGARQYRS